MTSLLYIQVTELISHGTESENETENGSDVDEEKNDRFAEEHEDITAQPGKIIEFFS